MLRPPTSEGFDQVHLFAGIGGWSHALRLAGWPDDQPVWTGSCPCQPLSVAGRRQGHADERHLWPAFHRLIAERRPPIVFGEQVASGDGREWLAGVRADLEATDMPSGPPICALRASERRTNRSRLYFVANADPQHVAARVRREHHAASARTGRTRPCQRQFVARRISGLTSRPSKGGDLNPEHRLAG